MEAGREHLPANFSSAVALLPILQTISANNNTALEAYKAVSF